MVVGGQYSDTRYVTILNSYNVRVPQTVTQLPQIPQEGFKAQRFSDCIQMSFFSLLKWIYETGLKEKPFLYNSKGNPTFNNPSSNTAKCILHGCACGVFCSITRTTLISA
jgi:hypothetical protein